MFKFLQLLLIRGKGITMKGAMSVVAFDDVPCWSTKTAKKQDEEPTKKSDSEGTQKERQSVTPSCAPSPWG